MKQVYDKRGIPLCVGDIIKVFHFIGVRRKRHYMYKQVVRYERIGENDYLLLSHLNFITNWRERDGPYPILPDDQKQKDYEIVQSIACDHEDRERM